MVNPRNCPAFGELKALEVQIRSLLNSSMGLRFADILWISADHVVSYDHFVTAWMIRYAV